MSSRLSKRIAFVLRHNPASADVILDPAGWTSITKLSESLSVSVAKIHEIVEEDGKQRYSIKDGKIRANQGHSIPVVIDFLEPDIVPAVLFHGTTTEAAKEILDQETGLCAMSRQFVHLSEDTETALLVASRRKGSTILAVDTVRAKTDGVRFFLSENKIWLAQFVPAKFLNRVE